MDDETFLDDEIYDDDASEHHPVDDPWTRTRGRTRSLPGDSDADSDADLDIATLGVEVASVDLAPSLSCFTPRTSPRSPAATSSHWARSHP